MQQMLYLTNQNANLAIPAMAHMEIHGVTGNYSKGSQPVSSLAVYERTTS